MENGLEISSRKFKEIEKISLVEFIDNDEKLLLIGNDKNKDLKIIIWDLYNTNKVKEIQLVKNLTIQNLNTQLTRSFGNILRVDDKGKVTSILKMIDIKLKKEKMNENNDNHLVKYDSEIAKEHLIKKELHQGNHIIYFYKDYDENSFKPVIEEAEPWVTDNYKEVSFCLCNDEIEVLQLIVGRSTIQIWHKILSDPNDENKRKENLPDEAKPFLEFIWTNGIPINQDNQENRLRIKRIQFGLKYFHLEVYWYEKDTTNEKKEMSKYEEEEKMDNMKEI